MSRAEWPVEPFEAPNGTKYQMRTIAEPAAGSVFPAVRGSAHIKHTRRQDYSYVVRK